MVIQLKKYNPDKGLWELKQDVSNEAHNMFTNEALKTLRWEYAVFKEANHEIF